MSKHFNINNDNYESGHYPLFFGKPLGIFDSFNQTYPEIEEADDKQRALFWKAKEISLVRDIEDMKNLDPKMREFVIENLSFQMAGDSFVAGSIQQLFLPIISNPQAINLVSYWGDTEGVHVDSYGRIIAQCFDDPNEIFSRIQDNAELLKRLDFISTNFRSHDSMLRDLANNPDMKIGPAHRAQVIRTIGTLLCLEGIMFLSSFAATFAVTEATQKLNGTSKMVGLIHNDEAGSHVRNNLVFMNIIKKKEKWPEYSTMKVELKEMLDKCVNSEFEWGEHMFNKVGSIVGYNQDLHKTYVQWLAKPIYDALELEYNFEVITEHPFPWMEKYIDPDLMQVAQQEAQSQNYLVNAIVDDTIDVDFDY